MSDFQLATLLLVLISSICGYVLYLIVFSLFQRNARKWITSKEEEIKNELSTIGLYYISEEINRFSYTLSGFYISNSSYQKDSEKRTKALTPCQFRQCIFDMYDTPYNEVLDRLFNDYENYQNSLIEERNNKLFSDNKHTKLVRFKKPEKEEK